MTARFLLYTRQSITADEASSLSLHFQERALRELVGRSDGTVLEPVIVDADAKGWEPNRPGIPEHIERPDAITVYIDRNHYDRLLELLASRRPMRRGKGVAPWLEGVHHCGCGAPMYLMADRNTYDSPRRRAAEPSQQRRFTL